MFRGPEEWGESNDQPWCPPLLRDCVTESLQAILNLGGFFTPILPRLRRAFEETRTHRIIDLCSGAGGPWLWMYQVFICDSGTPLAVCLTDKYPNARAFKRAVLVSGGNIQFHPEPVDATEIPAELKGFRTIFDSFHHFRPESARLILKDAVDKQEGIAIFEAASRYPFTIMLVFLVPVASLALAIVQRPFRWSRLFWTFLIPVIPIVLFIDGMISCLRAYSVPELTELSARLPASGYQWSAGREKGRFIRVPITYLIGYPNPATGNHPSADWKHAQ